MSKHKDKDEDREPRPTSFVKLLEAVDQAIEHEHDCVTKLESAHAVHAAAEAEAQAEADKAEAAAAAAAANRANVLSSRTAATRTAIAQASSDAHEASVAVLAAQQAIFDELAAKGDMYVTEADGSIAVYKAREPSATSPGWTVTHPISGS